MVLILSETLAMICRDATRAFLDRQSWPPPYPHPPATPKQKSLSSSVAVIEGKFTIKEFFTGALLIFGLGLVANLI
jgi:hypothetical protein